MGTFTYREDPNEMRHYVAFHQGLLCKGKKDLQTKEYKYLFENYNLTPLDMHNGLSKAYCI